jgi:hypothetical protein
MPVGAAGDNARGGVQRVRSIPIRLFGPKGAAHSIRLQEQLASNQSESAQSGERLADHRRPIHSKPVRSTR